LVFDEVLRLHATGFAARQHTTLDMLLQTPRAAAAAAAAVAAAAVVGAAGRSGS
jgi:hypothetical protein